MFEGFYFEFPKLVFIIFIFLACENLCPLRLPSLYIPHTRKFHDLVQQESLWTLRFKWFAIILFIIALMSPVKEEPDLNQNLHYREIVFALETSATDPKQLQILLEDIRHNIHNHPHDKIAILVFGSYPLIISPLTFDHAALAIMLPSVYADMAGEGSNLKSAQKSAYALFSGKSHHKKILIFFHHNALIEEGKDTKIAYYDINLSDHNYRNNFQDIISKMDAKEIDTPFKPEVRLYYYYFYPLFFGFVFWIVYVYLRNKQGVV